MLAITEVSCQSDGKSICEASLQKDLHVTKKYLVIFVDLNRAGHDKSVIKRAS